MDAALSKASVSEETFDEFLAEHGMLEPCEQLALAEIARDRAQLTPSISEDRLVDL